jgi:hypothetical protein
MDRVFLTFLENTANDAVELQARSDLVVLEPLPPMPPSRYRCTFEVPFLRRLPSGTVEIDPGPVECGISFPEDYLRSTDPKLFLKIASIMNRGFLHPNVQLGFVCLGSHFAPGTPIQALVRSSRIATARLMSGTRSIPRRAASSGSTRRSSRSWSPCRSFGHDARSRCR